MFQNVTEKYLTLIFHPPEREKHETMSSDNPVNCTINELRPNRRFLDPNFDCYRLASDQPQILQHKLKVAILLC